MMTDDSNNAPPPPEEDQNMSPATRKERLKTLTRERWQKSAAWREKVGKNVGTLSKNVGSNVGALSKNVGNKLQKVNLARLIDELEHDQELADKLEFINQETQEEAARKDLVREAMEACQAEIENHLEEFLERRPDATYEDWILDLHPDNVEQGTFFEDFTVVDSRFYVMDSDHRLLWNHHEKVPPERHVAARSLKDASSHSQAVDLLDDGPDTAPSTDGSSDSSPNFTAGMESMQEDEDQPSGSCAPCSPCTNFWPDDGDI